MATRIENADEKGNCKERECEMRIFFDEPGLEENKVVPKDTSKTNLK